MSEIHKRKIAPNYEVKINLILIYYLIVYPWFQKENQNILLKEQLSIIRENTAKYTHFNTVRAEARSLKKMVVSESLTKKFNSM